MIKRKKQMPLLIIPTASMGDIAFLLIIFFMLASNFMKSANVVAEEPASPDVEAQEPPQVSVVLDRDGRLWLQGIEIGVAELTAGVQSGIGEDRRRPVHVKIDKSRQGSDFLPVIEALCQADVKIMLVGTREDAVSAESGNQGKRGGK